MVPSVNFTCHKYEAVSHKFLCDNESFECDPSEGYDTYLEHLGKRAPAEFIFA